MPSYFTSSFDPDVQSAIIDVSLPLLYHCNMLNGIPSLLFFTFSSSLSAPWLKYISLAFYLIPALLNDFIMTLYSGVYLFGSHFDHYNAGFLLGKAAVIALNLSSFIEIVMSLV